MQTKKLAHLSDLHLGLRDAAQRAQTLCARLLADGIDEVVITGDLTHRGRAAEWAQFLDAFAPLIDAGRVTLVPGNHDRLADDVAGLIMPTSVDDPLEGRVVVASRPGLHVVRVDSTAPYNRFLISGHGALCDRVIAACAQALDRAPPDSLRVVLLHHHVLPAPVETFSEVLADLVALPFASELPLGVRLLETVAGRADLVLHGHRHIPRATELLYDDRPTDRSLGVYNAGSTTELGAYRVFRHLAGVRAPAVWTRFLPEVRHEVPVDPVPLRIGRRAPALPRSARGARLASA